MKTILIMHHKVPTAVEQHFNANQSNYLKFSLTISCMCIYVSSITSSITRGNMFSQRNIASCATEAWRFGEGPK